MKMIFFGLLLFFCLAATGFVYASLQVMPDKISATLYRGSFFEGYIYIVDDAGSDNFTWNLSTNATWIRPKINSGKGPATVKIIVDDSQPEENTNVIKIFSDIGNDIVTIKRTIREPFEGSVEGFSFTTNPSSVFLEILRIPGTEKTFSFQIGLTCKNTSEERLSCNVSTSSSWLIAEATPSCGSSFTVTIDPTAPGLSEGRYKGEVIVSCGGLSRTVGVELHLEDIIADKLYVSPREISYQIPQIWLVPHTFSVKLANANPQGRTFSWRAETEVPWLKVEPSSGYASPEEGTTVSVIVDPLSLPSGRYEGQIRFFSDLDEISATEGLALKVKLEILPWQTLGVFPHSLFWSIEKADDGLLGTFFPQRLHVFSGSGSWSAEVDVPWISLSSLWPAEEAPEGTLEVNIVEELARLLPYGRHEGHVIFTDRTGGFWRKVPIILEIRRPGEEIKLPVPSPIFSQLRPDFIRIEATEAGNLWLTLPAVQRSQEKEACDTFEGKIEKRSCQPQSRIYLTMESPSLWPGLTFAWRPIEGRFVLLAQNGVPLPEADNLYMTLGPISSIDFGPIRLRGLSGEVFFEVKAGPDYRRAQTFQRIALQIYTPQGQWQITDYYQGRAYPHPYFLSFQRNRIGWTACWESAGQCITPIMVTYGDGQTNLYRLNFEIQDFRFEYEIRELTSTTLKGRWRFLNGEEWSAWEEFQGSRSVFPPLLTTTGGF